ncbi:hypothetical protein [Agrilutibacter solisilvae]|uniref:Uncharacterized protein n=1 Tax=Agrilutibacter solisilvae TaxID=2763317 RepID=A0A974Y1Y8_9GAMM|nr:hypothetical protein [Lysobacter solisilvae]QSX79768.1 hypothetical protein I8J32_008030 [Lysobacter solisilvae]
MIAAQTKTRSALRTGLGATTRLRKGELRFRRGQSANVHRSDVAGGGPFDAARCRDRFTHFLPQETSAGRNLITLFVHVNIPAQLFSTRPARPSTMRARHAATPRAAELVRMPATRARPIIKLHKKRCFAKASQRARDCRWRPRCTRPHPGAALGGPERRMKISAGRTADFASHKSICAKTARAAAACGDGADGRPAHARPMRGQEKTRAVSGAGRVCIG